MFNVYILYSRQIDKYYVGQTENLEGRLQSHLLGISGFTSKATDWIVVYQEAFATRADAIRRENEIKRKKSRKYITWLIQRKK
ncbi:MAG TPA: GIY-YIG nuclease family protein [Cyclobacteriaceae bacterium]|nr:GIY-YIG nuclease family protein [Cyclobacteriaceae bacterium]